MSVFRPDPTGFIEKTVKSLVYDQCPFDIRCLSTTCSFNEICSDIINARAMEP